MTHYISAGLADSFRRGEASEIGGHKASLATQVAEAALKGTAARE